MGSTNVVQPVIFHDAFDKSLGLPPRFMDVVAGAVIANRMPGPAVRLALVGERDSGIGEVVDILAELEGKKPKSSLLVWCEAEGEGQRKRDKQFGALLEMVGQAGAGIIASCSDHLARRLKEPNTGENPFLLLRTPNLPVEKAIGDEPEMRRELKGAMSVLDEIRPPARIELSEDVRTYLDMLADFVARLRCTVPRDAYTREITKMPEVASKESLNGQLTQLIKGVVAVRGLDQAYDDEVRLIERVVLDSVPRERVEIVRELPCCGITTRKLADLIGTPRSVVHRRLQDLESLGIVERRVPSGFRALPNWGPIVATAKNLAA